MFYFTIDSLGIYTEMSFGPCLQYLRCEQMLLVLFFQRTIFAVVMVRARDSVNKLCYIFVFFITVHPGVSMAVG